MDYFSSAIAASLFFMISEWQEPLALLDHFMTGIFLSPLYCGPLWEKMLNTLRHSALTSEVASQVWSNLARKSKSVLWHRWLSGNAGPCSLNSCGCCKKWLPLGWILYKMACASLSVFSLVSFFFVKRELRTVRSLQSVLGCEGTQHCYPWTFLVIA